MLMCTNVPLTPRVSTLLALSGAIAIKDIRRKTASVKVREPGMYGDLGMIATASL